MPRAEWPSATETLAMCWDAGARAMGQKIGRIAAGYRADIVLLAAADWRYLAYHLAARLVEISYVGGELR